MWTLHTSGEEKTKIDCLPIVVKQLIAASELVTHLMQLNRDYWTWIGFNWFLINSVDTNKIKLALECEKGQLITITFSARFLCVDLRILCREMCRSSHWFASELSYPIRIQHNRSRAYLSVSLRRMCLLDVDKVRHHGGNSVRFHRQDKGSAERGAEGKEHQRHEDKEQKCSTGDNNHYAKC